MAVLIAAATALAGYAMAQTGTAVSASITAGSLAKTRTTTRTIRVATPGSYAVIVYLAAPKAPETVNVYVGHQNQLGVHLSGSQGARLAFSAVVGGRKFTVRVVSNTHAASFSVASSLQAAQSATPPVVAPTGSTSPTAPATGAYNTLVWSDEFTGAAGSPPNPANWTADSGGGCGSGTLSTNTANPANAQLDGNGDLAITALGASSNPPYSTAQLDTGGLFSFTYGKIEARIDVPPGQGLCSAFWLLADDGEALGWPNGGEIDVMEAIGDIPTQTNGFLHGPITPDTDGGNYQQWQSTLTSATPLAGGFHTYGLIWRPNSLTWTLDGVPFATATPAKFPPSATWVFNDHPFHIILDEAVGGWPGNPNASTVFPAAMRVDWVRVYQ